MKRVLMFMVLIVMGVVLCNTHSQAACMPVKDDELNCYKENYEKFDYKFGTKFKKIKVKKGKKWKKKKITTDSCFYEDDKQRLMWIRDCFYTFSKTTADLSYCGSVIYSSRDQADDQDKWWVRKIPCYVTYHGVKIPVTNIKRIDANIHELYYYPSTVTIDKKALMDIGRSVIINVNPYCYREFCKQIRECIGWEERSYYVEVRPMGLCAIY